MMAGEDVLRLSIEKPAQSIDTVFCVCRTSGEGGIALVRESRPTTICCIKTEEI